MTKILAVSFFFLLSGCVAPVVITGLSVASVATNEATGRGLADHAVSTVKNQDCKIARVLDNRPMCQDSSIAQVQITTTSTKPSSVAEIETRYHQ